MVHSGANPYKGTGIVMVVVKKELGIMSRNLIVARQLKCVIVMAD